MHILKELPDPQAVDALWEIHRQHLQALSDSSGIEGHLRCDLSFSALRACVQLTPQWLSEKIRDAAPAVDPVSELAWLLWDLKRPEAKDLWYQLKTILFEKVAPDEPRSLICCIGRFKDMEELPRLIGWLNCHDDFVQPAEPLAYSVSSIRIQPSTLSRNSMMRRLHSLAPGGFPSFSFGYPR
jgi:hypothetical protein